MFGTQWEQNIKYLINIELFFWILIFNEVIVGLSHCRCIIRVWSIEWKMYHFNAATLNLFGIQWIHWIQQCMNDFIQFSLLTINSLSKFFYRKNKYSNRNKYAYFRLPVILCCCRKVLNVMNHFNLITMRRNSIWFRL